MKVPVWRMKGALAWHSNPSYFLTATFGQQLYLTGVQVGLVVCDSYLFRLRKRSEDGKDLITVKREIYKWYLNLWGTANMCASEEGELLSDQDVDSRS